MVCKHCGYEHADQESGFRVPSISPAFLLAVIHWLCMITSSNTRSHQSITIPVLVLLPQ